MVKWNKTTDGKGLESDCGRFRITNSGPKGGAKYVLYGYNKQLDCHTTVLAMGRLDECKEAAGG